ncbi:MAG: hypothetical protein ACR2NM_11260 [Bythopirellula sp.]
MQLSPTRLFTCTACGAVLPIGAEQLGKKCRCGRCGKVSLVTEAAAQREKPDPALEQPIYFFCRVCDTRLGARVKDKGRKAKCPDCGALTRVPPPPKPKPPKTPKAMHGQQYATWKVDEAPKPEEIAARQPQYFPVWCRVCDTLMHATPQQVGKKLICPDCGAKSDIKQPPPPKPKQSPLVPDGQEYQLDAEPAPPSRPDLQFLPASPGSEKTQPELPPIREERKPRPKPPLMPTVQGIALMLVRTPVLSWFLSISAIGMTAGAFMIFVTTLNFIASIPFFVAAGITTVLCLVSLAAICLAVFTESAEGNDRLHSPPSPIFLDWVADVFYLVMPAVLAIVPWAMLCKVFEQNLLAEQRGILLMMGWLGTFPLLLLSSLENGSALEPFSPRIFASVTSRPGHWMLFVIQTAAVAWAAQAGVERLLAAESSLVGLLVIPLIVATALLYFRILGRFAWWLAESLATIEY